MSFSISSATTSFVLANPECPLKMLEDYLVSQCMKEYRNTTPNAVLHARDFMAIERAVDNIARSRM